MATIFGGIPGRVISVADDTVMGDVSIIKVDADTTDSLKNSAKMRVILVNTATRQSGNYQLTNSLGDDLFFYVFGSGNRAGQIVLMGYAFSGSCDQTNGIGIEDVFGWYQRNKLAARESPVKVTIGLKTTLVGYVTDMNTSVANPELNLHQFEILMIQIPQDNDGGAGNNANNANNNNPPTNSSLNSPSTGTDNQTTNSGTDTSQAAANAKYDAMVAAEIANGTRFVD